MSQPTFTGPVPASYYDHRYFETGERSNWRNGYTWEEMCGIFAQLSRLLRRLFAEARTYLDVGCAKGFLVRSLRDLGLEAWGFDHSEWAIEHADPAARPYVARAGVDDFEFRRTYDVLVATEVFEHLTEDQVRRFLDRARRYTLQALFATIPSFDTAAEASRYDPSQETDRSHVTLRERSWWRELFLETGWTRPGWAQKLDLDCSRDAFVRHMGWKVYIYAPQPHP